MSRVIKAVVITAPLVLTSGAKLVGFQMVKPTPVEGREGARKDSVAAELTRTKLLKTKVDGTFKEARIGDILKEFAAQVDMKADQPVMWSYGEGFPFAKSVTFVAKEVPLEIALDQLLTKSGGTLGYVVISKDGDKHDGWILLTSNGERGTEPQPATLEEETLASQRLSLAKKLIDAGKPNSAKPLLEILVKKYSTTKAGKEAKELLGKIEK